MKLAKGLPGDVLGSELRRKLFSPSEVMAFLLKLSARRRLPDDELPLR